MFTHQQQYRLPVSNKEVAAILPAAASVGSRDLKDVFSLIYGTHAVR